MPSVQNDFGFGKSGEWPLIPKGVSVTLVEPRGAVNVGHVARVMRNFGVSLLYLVNPKFDMTVAAVYASHASEILDGAEVATFGKVRRENELLIATTAVSAKRRSNVIRRTVPPEKLNFLLSRSKRSSIVFGRDTTGLTNEEIALCDLTTTIQTPSDYTSLNIGHAAAIVLYLASKKGRKGQALQGREAREVFAKNLLELGAMARLPSHRVERLYQQGKRLAASSGLTDTQLFLLAGIFKRATATGKLNHDLDSKT